MDSHSFDSVLPWPDLARAGAGRERSLPSELRPPPSQAQAGGEGTGLSPCRPQSSEGLGEGTAPYVQVTSTSPAPRAAPPGRALSTVSRRPAGALSACRSQGPACAASESRGAFKTQILLQMLVVLTQWVWEELREPVFQKAPLKILMSDRFGGH